jgi:hypothetical protein
MTAGIKSFVACMTLCVLGAACADESATESTHQFTFSWPFAESDRLKPRGGTSKGAPLTLLDTATDEWHALRAPGLSDFERDRRAILAMAGPYRTSFDFIETVGFTADFEPSRPYQSWGTEYIYVVADTREQIVLQHIMVMFVVAGDGELRGPFVQKHWRQEWQYEDRDLHVYAGHERWRRRTPSSDEVRGKWSQAVYQVDDSPRYEALGTWVHDANYSAWTSEETWRPLPRRESSVRDDYQVLIGTNRHTITPRGWVQEEENLKVAIDAAGARAGETPYLARELGVNRYERIVGFDWSAGDEYWRVTAPFWADVRAAWHEVYAGREEFELAQEVAGRELFEPMFEYAARLESGDRYDPEDGRRFIEETLAAYLD